MYGSVIMIIFIRSSSSSSGGGGDGDGGGGGDDAEGSFSCISMCLVLIFKCLKILFFLTMIHCSNHTKERAHVQHSHSRLRGTETFKLSCLIGTTRHAQ